MIFHEPIYKITRTQKKEQLAWKNGFIPLIREKDGMYVGYWKKNMKEGEFVI